MSGRDLVPLAAALVLLTGCANGNQPPAARWQTTCQAYVQDCIGGPAMNGQCMQYGPRRWLTDPGISNYFSAECPGYTSCDDPNALTKCMQAATKRCEPPACLLDTTSVQKLGCTNTCSAGTPTDPNARYRILSYSFTFTPAMIDATPKRVTGISSQLGIPVAIEASGFLDAVTNGPNNLAVFDLMPEPPAPPTLMFSGLLSNGRPNAFAIEELPDFLSDVVVADPNGLALYSSDGGMIELKKNLKLGMTTGFDLDPNVTFSDLGAAITISPNRVRVVPLSGTPMPTITELSGTPADVTMSLNDVWAIHTDVSGSGVITRLASPSGTKLGERAISGTPIAIGGGADVETTPFPGAIVVLVETPTGAELQLFLGGALNTAPIVFPLSTADFMNAKPVAMKAITIADKQYAWVALLTSSEPVVALFDLQLRQHLATFDVRLGTLEPLAVAVGLIDIPEEPPPAPEPPPPRNFLHVLVTAN